MKCVFYIASLYGGGAERVLVCLMNYLAGREEDVELILNQKSGPYLSLLDESITIHKLDAKYVKHSIFELAEYLNQSKPDFAMSTLDDCNYALALAGKVSKANPTILVRQSSSFLTKTKYLPVFRRIYERMKAKLFYPLADVVLVNSKGARNELARITRIEESKVQILPNPLDLKYIQSKAEEDMPGDLNAFLMNNPYILAVGRLEKAKGFDILLKAFSKISNKKYRLIILGEGGKREELQGMVNHLGINNRVYMPGYIRNPYSVMDKADLFVLSSRYEGMPNVLLETMALELPIIATDCPNGPRELLKGGKFGTLVPVENVTRLTEAIDKQVNENFLNKEERFRYIKQFDIDLIGSKFNSLLQKLAI